MQSTQDKFCAFLIFLIDELYLFIFRHLFKVLLPVDQLPTHQCVSVAATGWKCPCCLAICNSTTAIQKHMESHSGVKAFLCTICNYKGNTIRGMRTHIRVHFDKRNGEIMVRMRECTLCMCGLLKTKSSRIASRPTTQRHIER